MAELGDYVDTNPIRLIYFQNTHRIYLDPERCAYTFMSKEGAELFTAENPDTEYGEEQWTSARELSSACYAAGAESICLGRRNLRGSTKYEIREEDLERAYYNCELAGLSILLLKTQKKAYIRKFSECMFIVPIRIAYSPDLKITYATVINSQKTMMYLAFSTPDEYQKWLKKAGGEWDPLEVTYDGLLRICRHHGFLLNPFGEMLAVTTNLMKLIPHDVDDDDDDF